MSYVIPGTGYKFTRSMINNLTDKELIHMTIDSSDPVIAELAKRLEVKTKSSTRRLK